jgi:hypothetical protein
MADELATEPIESSELLRVVVSDGRRIARVTRG